MFGKRVAHKTVEHHSSPGGLLDFRFGLALMRDPRVPAGSKVVALGAGAGLTALAIVMELPLEAVVALFIPFIGPLSDIAFDGLEAVAGTMLFAALLLPHFTPAAVVQQVRAER
jgi:hypothetical protein